MNTTCLLEKLRDAVSKIERLATKQAGLPVLAGIYITVQDNNLILRATNLHVGAEISIAAQVEQEGYIVVDAQILQRTLNNLGKEKKVTLVVEGGNMALSTEKTNLLIKSYAPEDFPTLPKGIQGDSFSVPVKGFVEGVESVSYSASNSDIKPEISSVYMYPENGTLVFVATDSFRLAEKKSDMKNIPDFDGVLVPVKNISEIIQLLQNESNNIDIVVGESQISFTTDNTYCTSRLVDGSFPDYRQIIPSDQATVVTMVVDDLKQGLKIISIFADKYNQIDMKINPQDKECVIQSAHSDVGSSTTSIPVKITGDEVESRLNYTYITDVFRSLEKDSVQFIYNGNQKPIIVRATSDDSFTYLIMPMNR